MNNAKNKKDWMKNIIIIFLTIMLLLTLFSNTITNYSLPQVSTTTVRNGSISPKLRGTGIVESIGAYTVKAVESRNIASVNVSKGDHVDIGDTLFSLVDIESTELATAEDNLTKAEQEYVDALFAAEIMPETVEKVRAGNFDSIDTLTEEVASKQDEIDACQGELYVLQNKLAVQKLVQTIEDSKLSWTVMSVDEKKEWLDTEVKKLGIDQNIKKLQIKQIESGDYTDVSTSIEENGKTTTTTTTAKLSEDDKEYIANLLKEIDDIQMSIYYKTKESEDLATEDKIAKDIRDMNIANGKLLNKREVDEAQAKYDAVEARLKVLQTEKDNLLKDIKAQLGLKNKAESIAKQRENVQKLTEKSTGTVITAPIAGTIQTLSKVSGSEMKAGDELCVIVPDGMDMVVSISIDSKQSNKVKVGDEGTLANSWNYSDVVAIVSKIVEDTENQGKTKVTFTVTGQSVKIGQSLTISVGTEEKQYDTIVSKAAVNKDQGGTFVYKLNVKSSPLGNRYVAERVAVDVKDEDDNNMYITGDINQGDYVITSSNKMVEAGKQVRLSESSN